MRTDLVTFFVVTATVTAVLASSAGTARADTPAWLFSPLASPPPRPDGLSVPREVLVWRWTARTLTIAPTGATGPDAPPLFDRTMLIAKLDRAKSDGTVYIREMGGGLAFTLTLR